jgi:hypothetical protein
MAAILLSCSSTSNCQQLLVGMRCEYSEHVKSRVFPGRYINSKRLVSEAPTLVRCCLLG